MIKKLLTLIFASCLTAYGQFNPTQFMKEHVNQSETTSDAQTKLDVYGTTEADVIHSTLMASGLIPGSATGDHMIWNGTAWVPTAYAASGGDVWVDATDYGLAVGAASVDNAAAIQDALDYVSTTGGGTVFIPAGEYWVTGVEMTIEAPGTTIRGDGIRRTKIMTSSTTVDVFKNANHWYSVVQDLTVEKNVPDNTSTTTAFDWSNGGATSSSRFVFRNVEVKHFFKGFLIDHTTGGMFENCHAYDNVHGFYAQKTDATIWKSCFAGDGARPTYRTITGKTCFIQPQTTIWTSTSHGWTTPTAVTATANWETTVGTITAGTTMWVRYLGSHTFSLHPSSGEASSGANPYTDDEGFETLAASSTGWWIGNGGGGNSLANVMIACEGRWADRTIAAEQGWLTIIGFNAEQNSGNHLYVGATAYVSVQGSRFVGSDDVGEDIFYFASGAADNVSIDQCQIADPAATYYCLNIAEVTDDIMPDFNGAPVSWYNRTTVVAGTLDDPDFLAGTGITVSRLGNNWTIAASGSSSSIKDNLEVWYDFEETTGYFLDSHNGRNLERVGGAVTGTTSGRNGNYIIIDNAASAGDYARRPIGALRNTDGHFTVCMWIKQIVNDSNPRNHALLFGNATYTYTDTPWSLGYYGIGQNRFEIFKDGVNLKAATATSRVLNWCFLFARWDGETLYINTNSDVAGNVLDVGWSVAHLNTVDMDTPLYFQVGMPNGVATVWVDSVGIWSRALSNTEMTTLHNSGSGVTYSDL